LSSHASEPNTTRVRWRIIWLLLFWGLFGAGYSTYYYVRAAVTDQAADPLLWAASGALGWSFWAIATMAIQRLAKMFSFEKPYRWRSLPVHCAGSIVTTLVHVVWATLLVRLPWVLAGRETFQASYGQINWVEQTLSLRAPIDIMIYWGILIAIFSVDYYRRYLERDLRATQLEKQLVETELEVLKLHIQPHFLFNTLHSIVSLIREQDNEGAARMAVGLGELLRRVLSESGRYECPLRDEVEFLERYIEIERTRFQDRLDVSMSVADGTEAAYVPVLLLQPIVENAIRHGLAGRAGTCRLDISAGHDGKNLVIDITDSGSVNIDTPTSPGLGIGLGVTRQRIKAMYGAEGKIDLEQLTDSRTRVRVVLPFASTPLFETEATEDDRVD